MSHSEQKFFGKTVQEYTADTVIDNSGAVVYRLSMDYDDEGEMSELIDQFMARVDKTKLEALIIGMWGEPYDTSADDLIASLIKHAPQLPNLHALYIGDMSSEECEISWIVQGDYTPLLAAFTQLQALHIRGGNSLQLAAFEHASLHTLVIESGGLPSEIATALAGSRIPQLAHLELWLGDDSYGFDGDLALYQRVVQALRGPQLRYLGLRNAQIADELAQWLAGEDWLGQLDMLDLSLGTIGDIGAAALFASPQVQKLKTLDLSHHYISQEWQDKLATLPLEVLIDDEQDEYDYDEDEPQRYVAVGE